MSEQPADGRWGRVGPLVAMVAGVLAWLWPIGLGGAMPVGGDPTQFSIGLMAFLRSSIRAGRLPLWNDLWGFGFPGLAESQMGVYYPPHLLLYGLLPLEAAYTASLVAHTLWGGLGGCWAARRLGVSTAGSGLAGFSWAGCGFRMHSPPRPSQSRSSLRRGRSLAFRPRSHAERRLIASPKRAAS